MNSAKQEVWLWRVLTYPLLVVVGQAASEPLRQALCRNVCQQLVLSDRVNLQREQVACVIATEKPTSRKSTMRAQQQETHSVAKLLAHEQTQDLERSFEPERRRHDQHLL